MDPVDPQETWNIIPYVGFGPLTFDMSQKEVAQLLGLPESIDPIWNGSGITESRTIQAPTLGYDNTGKLMSIGIGSQSTNVRFNDLNIFTEEPGKVVRELYEANRKIAHIGLGSIVFWNLGLTLSGFYDEEEKSFHLLNEYFSGEQDDRTVRMFPKDDQEMRELESEFTLFSLSD